MGSRSLHSILKHAEVKKTKQDKNRLLVVVHNAWAFLWSDFVFSICQLQFKSHQRKQSHHGPALSHAISRHVCFGGKRSNGTYSSITFLSLVVKISLLLGTLCFGVIYLVPNNYTFTKSTSSAVPRFWKIGTRQILPSLPRQERYFSFSKWMLRQICRSFTVLRNLQPF